jgi:uncharacterized membrane protein
MRVVGLSAIACGLGLLRRKRPAGFLWGRVLGDMMDLAMLKSALGSRKTDRTRVLGSMAAVAGVTLLDAATAVRASGRVRRRPPEVVKAVTVNRPREEVYRFWRNFQNLPRFMVDLESVQVRDDRRSHWVARIPGKRTVQWDAEVVEDRPNELISWRSLPGGDVTTEGSVRFASAPGGRGTEVRVYTHFEPPGLLGKRALARLLNKGVELAVGNELRRFKQVMEVGEVVHSDASIHPGPHPARPASNGKLTSEGGRR